MKTNATPEAFALTHAAVAQLAEALSSANDPEDFFSRSDAIVNNQENKLLLPVQPGCPDPLVHSKYPQSEGNNSILVHEYLGAMDKSNASDPRLWNYLTFVTYRDYMTERWSLENVDNWKRRIEDRWLITNASRARLMRNGISRLWWIACLTWDASRTLPLSRKNNDSYAYTRQVLLKEDFVVGIFERNVGSMTTVVCAILEHLESLGKDAKGQYLKDLMKGVNLAHGYSDIGLLGDTAIRELINRAAPAT